MSATVGRETGMLDVGTHCAFCRQLDFLPFHCTFCNGEFCASHRSKEAHHCQWLLDSANTKTTVQNVQSQSKDNNGKFFQSLLPEKGYVRVQNSTVKVKEENRNVKPSNLRSTINKSALDKLAKFFKKRETSKILSSNKSKKGSTNKLIQLTKLKRTAKGDVKIPVSNRVYVYCYVVDDENEDAKEHELYVNKIWPIGRALDYIAQQLNVSNPNNDFKATSKEKLYLYKKKEGTGDLLCLESSGRVSADIKDLDILYLTRGEERPI